MHEEPTTVIIQRYLDALPGDAAAEPVVRELLGRPAGLLLCASLLLAEQLADFRPATPSEPALPPGDTPPP